MRQRWEQLLFLHWGWDPAAVQRTLPAGLAVDTWEGRAWLGVVPFFMRQVRLRGLPAVPGLSDFLELNVRTYVVDASGRPGVWFYSLDANQALAVTIARRWFHLPYERARLGARVDRDGGVAFSAQRRGAEHVGRFSWRWTAPIGAALPGTLDFFLVERYRLFAHEARSGRLWSGQVGHAPYQLGRPEVRAWDDGLLRLAGFDPAGRGPEHACAAAAVDVEVWPLRVCADPRGAKTTSSSAGRSPSGSS